MFGLAVRFFFNILCDEYRYVKFCVFRDATGNGFCKSAKDSLKPGHAGGCSSESKKCTGTSIHSHTIRIKPVSTLLDVTCLQKSHLCQNQVYHMHANMHSF